LKITQNDKVPYAAVSRYISWHKPLQRVCCREVIFILQKLRRDIRRHNSSESALW